ncbi:MAG: cysteine--tRNA ligase [Nanoarchaeota archaeon]|nr:cysteine--tRNA ligase [Nanoarchaeota archaeon]
MSFKIYNSLSRKKEVFKPIHKGKVSIYTCGQTVYDDLHLGHARTYSYWDVLVRYLRYKGYEVTHVQNFTDVGHLTSDADEGEDKIEKRAKERKVDPYALVEKFIQRYFEDLDALNLNRADIYPRATQHVQEMIDLTKRIIKSGYAYEKDGNVYFKVRKFKDYGTLSPTPILQKKSKCRVHADTNKNDPNDFTLWRKVDSNVIMKWDSPWSVGVPGWHVECSAMSMKYLGETLDIHGGGYDHLYLHHPNEIAQSEAATSKRFANYWMHTTFMTLNGEKMSKSTGNMLLIRDALKMYDWEALRLTLVSSHYRKQIDFNKSNVRNSEALLLRVYRVFERVQESTGGKSESLNKWIREYRVSFEKAMDDDLNTPKAVDVTMLFLKKVSQSLGNKKSILEKSVETVKELLRVLGLRLDKEIVIGVTSGSSVKVTLSWKELVKKVSGSLKKKNKIDGLMEQLISLRVEARSKKDYATSDDIRTALKKAGVELEDTDSGVKWRVK